MLTHKNQLEADGEEMYLRRQRSLFNLDMEVNNESSNEVSGK